MAAAAVLLSHCCHWTVITAIAEEQPTCTSTGDGECTDDDNINIILPAAAAAAAASSDTNTKPDTNTNTANKVNANQCQLYLAPSTLPHAGLGLYAGGTSPIPPHQSISTHRDLVLPILDPYKAHPHRGQQRFPSYLAYAHPKRPGALATELHNDSGPSRAFPTVPQVLWDMDTGFNAADGVKFYWEDVALNDLVDLDPPTDNEEGGVEDVWEEPMNAFVPGLSMLVNHHCELNNMDRLYSEDREEDDSEDDEEEEKSAGAGIEYVALKSIRAGMELLIDYGPEYDKQNDLKLSYMERQKKRTNNVQHRQKHGHIHGIDTKWDRLDKRELYQLPDQLPTEKAKRERQSIGFTKDSFEATTTTTSSSGGEQKKQQRPFSEYRENTYLEFDENDDDGSDYKDVEGDPSLWVGYPSTLHEITKSLAWLGEHGVCLSFADKLAIAPSNNNNLLEQGASGRGLYATSPIQKGETIVTSPLVAMRKEDFVIYKSNPEQEFKRNILDKTQVLGKEVLLNYAFAHPDSPLYLVPTAPLANFMNHGGGGGGGTKKKKTNEPNVQIRWPEGGSNTAKLFEWAYNQPPGSHFQSSFEEYYSTTSSSSDSAFRHTSNPWLESHPIDVMERSGKLALEYVALRDIEEDEELLIDYGELWERAWESYSSKRNDGSDEGSFRHPIGVPSDFYPDNWLHVTDQYEIAELQDLENNPLPTGEAKAITYAHNGKPVGSKYAYVIGLKQGFSDSFLKFAEENGVIELYRKLLTEQDGFKLESDAFRVYDTGTLVNKTSPPEADPLEFFAHRYATAAWNLKFNMHYAAAWNDAARRSVLAALGDSGFDEALNGIGQRFGYDNMTCFHGSFMGLTHCEKSIMHTDIYATNDQSWNMVFPLITVDGTEPELDIMAEDMNTVIGVHYIKDVVYAMGDWGYHQTRPMAYYNPEDDPKDYGDLAANGVPIRVVFGAYCSQIDETNVAAIRHVYDGDDPAPFADQFVDLPTKEIHWDRATGSASLAKPRGRGT